MKKNKKRFFKKFLVSFVVLLSFFSLPFLVNKTYAFDDDYSFSSFSFVAENLVFSSDDLYFINFYGANFYESSSVPLDSFGFLDIAITNFIDLKVYVNGAFSQVPSDRVVFSFWFETDNSRRFTSIELIDVYYLIGGTPFSIISWLPNLYIRWNNNLTFVATTNPYGIDIGYGLTFIDHVFKTTIDYTYNLLGMAYNNVVPFNFVSFIDIDLSFANQLVYLDYRANQLRNQGFFSAVDEYYFYKIMNFNFTTKLGFVSNYIISLNYEFVGCGYALSSEEVFPSAFKLIMYVGTLPIYYLQSLFSFKLLGVDFYVIVFSFVAVGIVLYFLIRNKR